MKYDKIRIVIIIFVIFVIGSSLSLLFIRVQFVPISYQSYWMYPKVTPPPTHNLQFSGKYFVPVQIVLTLYLVKGTPHF